MTVTITTADNKKFIFTNEILDEAFNLCKVGKVKYYSYTMIEQTFEYLICKFLNPNASISSPYYIDRILHKFILETSFYAKLCKIITGNDIIEHSILGSVDSIVEKYYRRLQFLSLYKHIFDKEYKILKTYQKVNGYEIAENDKKNMNSLKDRELKYQDDSFDENVQFGDDC